MLARVVEPGRLSDIATVEQGMGTLLKGRSDPYVEQTLVARQAQAAPDAGHPLKACPDAVQAPSRITMGRRSLCPLAPFVSTP